jgi:intracellular sulfur oxidation DsrE/DsrF family protein
MRTILIILALLLLAGPTAAERPDDHRALAGIDEGRILWDVTLGDPDALLARLQVIEQTYRDLVRQDVKPRMLFTFHGPAIRLLARDIDRFDVADVTAVRAVQEKLAELKALDGVSRIEACSIAAGRADLTEPGLIAPAVMVGNTFVTAAAYAQRGYAKIRID